MTTTTHKGKVCRVITTADILHALKHPIAIFLFGILASYIAFQAGINYSRQSLEVHSITRNSAFIEIAGQENLYELDWTEEAPIYWNH